MFDFKNKNVLKGFNYFYSLAKYEYMVLQQPSDVATAKNGWKKNCRSLSHFRFNLASRSKVLMWTSCMCMYMRVPSVPISSDTSGDIHVED